MLCQLGCYKIQTDGIAQPDKTIPIPILYQWDPYIEGILKHTKTLLYCEYVKLLELVFSAEHQQEQHLDLCGRLIRTSAPRRR